MKRLAEFLLDVLGRLPTTNARIALSLVLYGATGVSVLIRWTPPPWEWLVFMAAAMGLDLLQFGTKRVTHHNEEKSGG